MTQQQQITPHRAQRFQATLEGNREVHEFFHDLVVNDDLRLAQITYALAQKEQYFREPSKL